MVHDSIEGKTKTKTRQNLLIKQIRFVSTRVFVNILICPPLQHMQHTLTHECLSLSSHSFPDSLENPGSKTPMDFLPQVSNLSILPPKSKRKDLQSFATGPSRSVLDRVSGHIDTSHLMDGVWSFSCVGTSEVKHV